MINIHITHKRSSGESLFTIKGDIPCASCCKDFNDGIFINNSGMIHKFSLMMPKHPFLCYSCFAQLKNKDGFEKNPLSFLPVQIVDEHPPNSRPHVLATAELRTGDVSVYDVATSNAGVHSDTSATTVVDNCKVPHEDLSGAQIGLSPESVPLNDKIATDEDLNLLLEVKDEKH